SSRIVEWFTRVLVRVLAGAFVKSGLRPDFQLILERQRHFPGQFKGENGLLIIFIFSDRLLGNAISYHRRYERPINEVPWAGSEKPVDYRQLWIDQFG
ncbi:MAG: hypothetical protein KKH60_11760, partial [Proteobacteria bacterium]|nr:hypothetical protein [Pseudomonadota bacterium]